MDDPSSSSKSHLPECVFDEQLQLFHLVKSRGKIQAKFGVSFCPELDLISIPEIEVVDKQNERKDMKVNRELCSSDYLFVEEVLYLLQRGLIRSFVISIHEHTNNNNENRLELHYRDIFATFSNGPLNSVNCKFPYRSLLPLPLHLAYMHLRSQSYVVFRHKLLYCDDIDNNTDHMFNDESNHTRLIQPMQVNDTEYIENKNTTDDAQIKSKQRLKERRRRALVATSNSPQLVPDISFDVYLQKNGTFRKTNPGPPDFVVAVTSFNDLLPLMHMKTLMDSANGIPLKIATVSDSGTVVMFGFSNDEIPPINSTI